MALGGGTWLTQNKVIPGSYINFVSVTRASVSLSDRGYAALPLILNWGPDGEIFTVEQEDFQEDSLKIFGYSYDADELKGLRDLFKNAKTLYAYRLNSGIKASNVFAKAKYTGSRGNDITIVINTNVDDTSKLDVMTYIDTTLVDTQTVSEAKELVDNDYVDFIKDAELIVTAGSKLTGGTSGGVKASNDYAVAVTPGTAGNNFKISITANADDTSKFDVKTLEGENVRDTQTVTEAKELVANKYVGFITTATLEVGEYPLTGGNDNLVITGNDYQTFLDKIESYNFNTLGCLSTNDVIKSLFVSFTQRMRDDMGVKFQTVLYNCEADYEGVINIKNNVTDEGTDGSELVYWTTGASAGCAVNRSNTNKTYNGEYTVNVDFKQSMLKQFVKEGYFVFHKVGDEVRVLTDINSFVSITKYKNEDFQANQVIRVLDQIGNDIAILFNSQYIGKIQNNQAGRIAFWNDIVAYNKELERIEALTDVVADDVKVEKGQDKKSVMVVNKVTPVCAMEKLYMTVVVS